MSLRNDGAVTTLCVLGPLEVRDGDGCPIRLTSQRQRRLLSALALRANSHVAGDALVDLVWGDALPEEPNAALQTNVARLRRVLPPDLEIVTEARGYRLVVDRRSLDATAFEDAVVAGRCDDAMRVWRGDPYAELDDEGATAERARLHELHAAAVETWAQRCIDTGSPNDAIPPLEKLVAEQPLRESAVAVLMQALASAGRQADALRVFTRLRHALAEDLGIEPSAALRALEEQVLLGDGSLGAPAAAPLPLPVSTFVGRRADVDGVCALLRANRIVTLCGPGGVGKTRLATQVAHRVAAGYADGVALVDLAAASTPESVHAAFAGALRISAPAGRSVRDQVVDVLRVRHHLLVVDNCDQVVDAIAELIEHLTMATATIDVLATSREPLRVDGEHVFTVGPLPPDEAVALLRDRIDAASGGAALAADDARLAEIATRLDGLPLALELAAARVRSLGIDGLIGALDESLSILQTGRRTASLRHRSLRDVVQWSYDLLPDTEQRLFEVMGVFAGAVDAGGITQVCAEFADAGSDLRALLADLVDRSLVTTEAGPPTRYGMLATVRAFARERLAGTHVAPVLRERHARWVVDLLEDIATSLTGPDESVALARFDAHVTEVSRAFAWLVENGYVEDVLRIAVVVAPIAFESMRGDLTPLVDEAVSVAGDADHPLTPVLLGHAASLAWQRADIDRCEHLCRRALDMAGTARPEAGRYAEQALANVLFFKGEFEAAIEHGRRAVSLSIEAGDPATEAYVIIDVALVEAFTSDPHAADDLARGAQLAAQLRSPRLQGWAAYMTGESIVEHDAQAAVPHLERAVALAAEVNATFLGTVARHTLLTSAGRSGTVGLDAYWRLIDDWHRAGIWTQLWIAVRALAEALSHRNDHANAVRLLAAHEASARAQPAHGADAERLAAVEAAARQALGPAYDSVYREGSQLDDDAAVALARRVSDSSLAANARRSA